MIIALDFDGTCVNHAYPEIGFEIGSVPVLKALQEKGFQFILFTMRSGDLLQNAVNWFEDNDIKLFGINENPEQKSWTNSPKPYAHLYIDDAGCGIPLIRNRAGRPFVNWNQIITNFWLKGIFTSEEMHNLEEEVKKIYDENNINWMDCCNN